MPLTPTAEVTPLNPASYSYDPAAGIFNHYVYLNCLGVWHDAWPDKRLIDQYNEDKTIFYFNPIDSPAPSSIPSPWYKYALLY